MGLCMPGRRPEAAVVVVLLLCCVAARVCSVAEGLDEAAAPVASGGGDDDQDPRDSRDIVGGAAFNRTVLASPFVTLVEFHSGMCGSCREFAPTWDELSWGPLLAGVRFVRVDIDEEANLKLALGRGLLDDGVPCIVLFEDVADAAGHVVMTGDHKLPTDALLHRITHELHLSRSAASKGRFVRRGLLKEGAVAPRGGAGPPGRAQRLGQWLSELSRMFGSDLRE